MTDYQPPLPKEPGPQPDPMLNEGRRSRGWMYLIGAIIVVVVVGTLFALNSPTSQQASKEAAPQTAGQSGTPQTPISGGRTTSSAPPEQTTSGQGGSGNAGASNNPGGKPGNTAR